MSFLRSAAQKGLAVVICAVSGLAVSAQAADGLSLDNRSGAYAVVKGGYAFVDTDDLEAGPLDLTPDSAYLVAAGAGCYVHAFRFEVEGVYAWASQDDSANGFDANLDLSIIAPMVNAYYDIPLADRFTAYVGAGAGWAFAQAELNVDPIGFSEDDNESAFAWQLMAGLGYQVADHVTLTAGYRFFDATGDVDVRLHTIEVGARFDF